MLCVWIIIVQDGKTPLQLTQEDSPFITEDEKIEIRKVLESYLQEVNNLLVTW